MRDFITSPLRATLSNHKNPISRFVSAMLTCTWCTGMYTGFALAAYGTWIAGLPWRTLPLTGLGIAWLAPVLADWLDPEPPELIEAEIVDDSPVKD